ncbi:sensor histidine kinase [Terricaulis silvestris]|uniref:histidine kinase n=1 Tax=Terricaulis silvestris TaxID=2686094 RepID=A0A6I6MUD2_9CAUL|nr:HAMP domain-containing sensor histidine kinase [Terricaulis silvestris]QGZ96104.1 Osmolarity sensor protein EnvZ [Terricaulis silvestris]
MTNPLNTLTGRLVLVTIMAVLLSYTVAFFIYANERGAALRRAAETAVIERVAYTAERLRETPSSQRAFMAETIRDFSIRYSVDETPSITASSPSGPGARVSRAVAQRIGGDVRGSSRTVEAPSRRWRVLRDGPPGEGREFGHRERRDDAGEGPMVRSTEVSLSVQLDNATWLNARARLPGPRPAPFSVLVGALVSIIAVGIGAALISRQIGRPLADLANAARALGSGQANVSAPVSGPDDVRRASTAFNAMAERLGRQLNRQRQMLWALSHDLRTPITAIRLRAELIEDEATRQRLLGSVEEMERLTEQALSLARAGASEEARSTVDLAEIARTLCGELQDMGVNATADAPQAVMAECRPSELARAMRNLAENAAKYGGGGMMRVYRSPANEVVVEVSDDGPGVAPDQLSKLAAPFFRADDARSEANGAGLGLAIAQAIAEAHGGRLVLENRIPRGFSAKLVLPG